MIFSLQTSPHPKEKHITCDIPASRVFLFFQTRLYAAQAARKVEFTGAAERVKFQPQDVQVSGSWRVFLLHRDASMWLPEQASPLHSPWLVWVSLRVLPTPSRTSMYVWKWWGWWCQGSTNNKWTCILFEFEFYPWDVWTSQCYFFMLFLILHLLTMIYFAGYLSD